MAEGGNAAIAAAPRSEPKLTIKQETFVNALLETGNQYEAYSRAYECKNMSRGAVARLRGVA